MTINLISDEYKKQLILMHNKSFGSGAEIKPELAKLIESGQVKTILDWGCGKGFLTTALRKKYPECIVYQYDPITFPNDLPDKVDLIISSDVLEHVEPKQLKPTLRDLYTRATKYQYHYIACHPAKKHLPDGRNAHLIIEEPSWWARKIKNLNKDFGCTNTYEHIEDKKIPNKYNIRVIKYVVVIKHEIQ